MSKIDFTEYFRSLGCPTPRKARFVDEAKAEKAMAGIHRNGITVDRPTRTYLCECGWWHLSSRPIPAELDKADAGR